MIPSNLSRSDCNCSSILSFSRSSPRFFSITFNFVLNSSNSLVTAPFCGGFCIDDCDNRGRVVAIDGRDEPGGALGAGLPSSVSSPSTPAESVIASEFPLSVSAADESFEVRWRREGRLDSTAPDELKLCLLVLLVGPDIDGRDVREAAEGAGGGPIEALVVLDGRDLVVGGREVSSIDRLREDNCFVGDFIGDCTR